MSTGLVPAVYNGDGGEIRVAREYSQVSGVQRVTDAMTTMKAIRTFVLEELVPDHDFGKIPGAGEKKVLLQPGAQKIIAFFESFADQNIERCEMPGGHVEFVVTTYVVRYATGQRIGFGIGSCSSMESKYRFRNANRICPKCGKETIFKSKKEGEGFYCWATKGGCNAKFGERDQSIVGQNTGKVENDNPYDIRNTVLKMACKRSMVAASLSLGCASDLFTQDLDDTYDINAVASPPPAQEAPAQAPPALAPTGKPAASISAHAFIKTLESEGKRLGRDLLKSANWFGSQPKRMFPAEIKDWSPEQIARCDKWLTDKLAAPAPNEAPAPATTAQDHRDENRADLDRAYQPAPAIKRFLAWLMEALQDGNKSWKNNQKRIKAGIPDDHLLVDYVYQLSSHLGKWAETRPHLNYTRPEPFDDKLVAERLSLIFDEHFDDLAGELLRYIDKTLPERALAEAAKRSTKSKPETQDEPGENG